MSTKRTCKNCGGHNFEGILKSQDDFCADCRSERDTGNGTIQEGEHHPSADIAMAYIKQMRANRPGEWFQWMEAMASTALSGNRLAEICLSTMQRIQDGFPVSDRYVLGLAYYLQYAGEEVKRVKR